MISKIGRRFVRSSTPNILPILAIRSILFRKIAKADEVGC
jgi:hypothetical protein